MKKSGRIAGRIAASLSTYAHASNDEATITAIRTASNHAIQAGDIAALSASLADDFVVVVGNGALLTRVQYIAAFEHDFGTPGIRPLRAHSGLDRPLILGSARRRTWPLDRPTTRR